MAATAAAAEANAVQPAVDDESADDGTAAATAAAADDRVLGGDGKPICVRAETRPGFIAVQKGRYQLPWLGEPALALHHLTS